MTITSEQLRAARAYLHLPQSELARKAHVSIATLRRLEAMDNNPIKGSSVDFVKKVLENAGIEFVGRGIMPKIDDKGARLHRVKLLLEKYRRKIKPCNRLTEDDLYDENGLPL